MSGARIFDKCLRAGMTEKRKRRQWDEGGLQVCVLLADHTGGGSIH